MTKFINFIFLILSLLIIVSLAYTINDIFAAINGLFGSSYNLNNINFANLTLEEILYQISGIGLVASTIFGFPVTIFLVSLNGMKK